MQVGLTRHDLLSLIAKYADDLSSEIDRGATIAAHEGVTDQRIDELVSRMSALTKHLFDPPASILATQ